MENYQNFTSPTETFPEVFSVEFVILF